MLIEIIVMIWWEWECKCQFVNHNYHRIILMGTISVCLFLSCDAELHVMIAGASIMKNVVLVYFVIIHDSLVLNFLIWSHVISLKAISHMCKFVRSVFVCHFNYVIYAFMQMSLYLYANQLSLAGFHNFKVQLRQQTCFFVAPSLKQSTRYFLLYLHLTFQ